MSKKTFLFFFFVCLLITLVIIIIIKLIFELNLLEKSKNNISYELNKLKTDLQILQSRDEYKINKTLEKEIKNIETTYNQTVKIYESLLDLKTQIKKLRN